jgi:hypothetical protein
MIYILLDSNILLRFISQGRPGCELAHFDALLKLLGGKSHCLLLPEVIELELVKLWGGFEDEVNAILGALEATLNALELPKKAKWSETDDVFWA